MTTQNTRISAGTERPPLPFAPERKAARAATLTPTREVLLGLTIGTLALEIFALRYLQLHPGRMNLPLLLSVSLAVLLVLHGAHLPMEQMMRYLASIARTTTQVCRGL